MIMIKANILLKIMYIVGTKHVIIKPIHSSLRLELKMLTSNTHNIFHNKL